MKSKMNMKHAQLMVACKARTIITILSTSTDAGELEPIIKKALNID